MPQAISPNRLQPDSPLKDNIAYINDNFDKTVQAINDLGGKQFGGASYSASIAPGYMNTQVVDVTDTRNQYVAGNTPINPVVKVYVDVDADDDYLIGFGGSLTSGQADAMISVWVFNGYSTGTVGNFLIQIANRDAIDAHIYYVYLNNYAFNTPTTGIFR